MTDDVITDYVINYSASFFEKGMNLLEMITMPPNCSLVISVLNRRPFLAILTPQSFLEKLFRQNLGIVNDFFVHFGLQVEPKNHKLAFQFYRFSYP